MSRIHGVFTPGMDHSFTSHDDAGRILGGIVVCAYFGRSMAAHMAGDSPRGGWQFETVIKDLYEPGVDMVVLGMTRDTCKWLDYQPKRFRSNIMAITPGVTANGW